MIPAQLPANVALLLDFDGTLVDIAARPDLAVVAPALTERLHRLYQRTDGALALISGRHVSSLRHFLPDFPGVIAGSHGAELSLDAQTLETFHGLDIDPAALSQEAKELAAPHPSILIEDKPLGVAMHYRADPSLQSFVEEAMQTMLARHPGMALQPAKMALELHPAGFGKDGAVARVMSLPAFAGRVPVYAGDDLMDEPAMAEVQKRGGFGIKIGPGDSIARYRMDDPVALAAWLDAWLAASVAG
ncbi:trehalose-phosphatase [Paracoccus caeni]|uniref:Trehalose 6-phosphate phosphatase n=1 Tax=Paracoccus caeni TaxID=657651 RepID=A0A934W1G2_9RHOB|nr:trehalose-phosphatase [Paracoccus caeni]MBK4217995.1 trehalose-phosphatase [Paracoccus caeni]